MEEELQEQEEDTWTKKLVSSFKQYRDYYVFQYHVFSRNNLPRIKDLVHVINLVEKKKIKEHIGFHYLMTEIHLYTLVLLELNTFRKKN